MGAGAKLDRLWIEWLIYATFRSVVELLSSNYSLFDVALRIGITAGLASFLIHELKQKSSLVWAFGVVFGFTGAFNSALDVIEQLAHGEALDTRFVLAVASGLVHFRMFWVLRDREVKQHVMSS